MIDRILKTGKYSNGYWGRVGKMTFFSLDYNGSCSRDSKVADHYALSSFMPHMVSTSDDYKRAYADSEEELKQQAEVLLQAWLERAGLCLNKEQV